MLGGSLRKPSEESAPTTAASVVLEDRVRSPCSKKMNLPPGLRTRLIPRITATTPGTVHDVKVLTTVSTLPSSRGNAFARQIQELDGQLR